MTREEKLRSALADIMKLIDGGTLVRNVQDDHGSGWALRKLPLVMALKTAHDLLDEPQADHEWRTMDSAPKDGTPIAAQRTVRYMPYKPDGKRQMGTPGRWQEANGYGGWQNCEEYPEMWQPLATGEDK